MTDTKHNGDINEIDCLIEHNADTRMRHLSRLGLLQGGNTTNVHDYMRLLVGDLLAVTEIIIKERDQARREVCYWMNTDASGCVKSGSEETAIERGWDCFKEETQ